MTIVLLITFASALIATLIAAPIAKTIARKVGLVDHPDKQRKLHNSVIPLIGGVTVFFTTLITTVVVLYQNDLLILDAASNLELLGLLIAASVLLLIGLIDDRFALRGRQKLFGQVIVATILIAFGYSFDAVSIHGFQINFGHFSLILMYAWILGGINSVNLLDGADGFATTLGILMSAGLCIMSFFSGNIQDAVIMAAMCGALVGFLRFNFPPASAYLGDCGSMLIGMMIAGIAIRSAEKQPMAYAFFAPLALLAIPMIDTGAAIIRRRLTGKSIYATDRGHLHHALIRSGLSPRMALLWFALLCLTTVLGATFSSLYQQSEYAFVSIIAVLCCLIGFKFFGFTEFKLVSDKAVSVGKSFLILGKNKDSESHRQVKVRLQGNRNWESIWSSIIEFAKKYELDEITLDLDLPWIHESFHATYRNTEGRQEENEWYSEIPLQVTNRIIGRVLIKANLDRSASNEVIPNFIDMLSGLEPYLLATIEKKSQAEIQSVTPNPDAARETLDPAEAQPQDSSSFAPNDVDSFNAEPAEPTKA